MVRGTDWVVLMVMWNIPFPSHQFWSAAEKENPRPQKLKIHVPNNDGAVVGFRWEILLLSTPEMKWSGRKEQRNGDEQTNKQTKYPE